MLTTIKSLLVNYKDLPALPKEGILKFFDGTNTAIVLNDFFNKSNQTYLFEADIKALLKISHNPNIQHNLFKISCALNSMEFYQDIEDKKTTHLFSIDEGYVYIDSTILGWYLKGMPLYNKFLKENKDNVRFFYENTLLSFYRFLNANLPQKIYSPDLPIMFYEIYDVFKSLQKIIDNISYDSEKYRDSLNEYYNIPVDELKNFTPLIDYVATNITVNLFDFKEAYLEHLEKIENSIFYKEFKIKTGILQKVLKEGNLAVPSYTPTKTVSEPKQTPTGYTRLKVGDFIELLNKVPSDNIIGIPTALYELLIKGTNTDSKKTINFDTTHNVTDILKWLGVANKEVFANLVKELLYFTLQDTITNRHLYDIKELLYKAKKNPMLCMKINSIIYEDALFLQYMEENKSVINPESITGCLVCDNIASGACTCI